MIIRLQAYVNRFNDIFSAMKANISKPLFIISFFTYLSASIAFTIVSKTINIYMSDMFFDLHHIALASIFVSIPQTYKVFIIALIDYLPLPIIAKLGRSKTLLLYFHLIIASITWCLSIVQSKNVLLLLFLCFIGCIFGICLDSISSGYFNNIAQTHDRSWMKGGNIGYNLGVLIALQSSIFFSQYYSWAMIYKYSACSMILILPMLIFGPKCNKKRYIFNAQEEQTYAQRLLSPYKKPAESMHAMHKAYIGLLGIVIAFYRAPDRILGPIITNIKIELFGKPTYLILQGISGIATIISPLLWSEINNTHYGRLIIINRIHTASIASLGLSIFLWQYTQSAYYLYLSMCIFIALKFIRILESSACFAYHCDLAEKQFFQTQLSIISSIEQISGKILSFGIAYLMLIAGKPVLLFIISLTSSPAIIALHYLKYKQAMLTKQDEE